MRIKSAENDVREPFLEKMGVGSRVGSWRWDLYFFAGVIDKLNWCDEILGCFDQPYSPFQGQILKNDLQQYP